MLTFILLILKSEKGFHKRHLTIFGGNTDFVTYTDNKQIGTSLCVFPLRNDAIFTTWEFSDVL